MCLYFDNDDKNEREQQPSEHKKKQVNYRHLVENFGHLQSKRLIIILSVNISTYICVVCFRVFFTKCCVELFAVLLIYKAFENIFFCTVTAIITNVNIICCSKAVIFILTLSLSQTNKIHLSFHYSISLLTRIANENELPGEREGKN